MRCPGCNFVGSDLRDLCPKCYLDLRPHKKVLGLPIAKPEATYNELLGRTAQKKKPIAAKPTPVKAVVEKTQPQTAAQPSKETISTPSAAKNAAQITAKVGANAALAARSLFTKIKSAASLLKPAIKAAVTSAVPQVDSAAPSSPATTASDAPEIAMAKAVEATEPIAGLSIDQPAAVATPDRSIQPIEDPLHSPQVMDLSNAGENLESLLDTIMANAGIDVEAIVPAEKEESVTTSEVDIVFEVEGQQETADGTSEIDTAAMQQSPSSYPHDDFEEVRLSESQVPDSISIDSVLDSFTSELEQHQSTPAPQISQPGDEDQPHFTLSHQQTTEQSLHDESHIPESTDEDSELNSLTQELELARNNEPSLSNAEHESTQPEYSQAVFAGEAGTELAANTADGVSEIDQALNELIAAVSEDDTLDEYSDAAKEFILVENSASAEETIEQQPQAIAIQTDNAPKECLLPEMPVEVAGFLPLIIKPQVAAAPFEPSLAHPEPTAQQADLISQDEIQGGVVANEPIETETVETLPIEAVTEIAQEVIEMPPSVDALKAEEQAATRNTLQQEEEDLDALFDISHSQQHEEDKQETWQEESIVDDEVKPSPALEVEMSTYTETVLESEPAVAIMDSTVEHVSDLSMNAVSLEAPRAIINPEEIIQLFEQSRQELDQFVATDMEFVPQQFLSREHDEHTELLFVLAYAIFEDPETNSLFDDDVLTSDKRTVDSFPEITAQLDKVNKISEIPKFSLKNGTPDLKKPEQKAAPIAATFRACSSAERLEASLIDCLSILLFSLGTAILACYALELPLWQIILSPSEWTLIDLLLPLSIFLACITLFSILYPLCTFIMIRGTFGMLHKDLELKTAQGKRPKLSQLIYRACSQPLSLFLFGFIPVLRGKAALHDRLSGTYLQVEEESAE